MNFVNSFVAIPALIECRIIRVVFLGGGAPRYLHVYHFHRGCAHVSLIVAVGDLESLSGAEKLLLLWGLLRV